ncbi:MAG: SMI1/KNR4 family protein [Bacteroidia bacterium]
MSTQIEKIKSKLHELASKDKNTVIFGASKHKYQLNSIRTEAQVSAFEAKHKIKLPTGYRAFIKEIGDGGAGPYYGLESLETSLYNDLDYKDDNELIDPSIPFPHTEAWNMEMPDTDSDEYDELYFDKKLMGGVLRLCNYGCGVSMNLVVTGSEAGNMWVDDRCNENGIFPDQYFGNEEKIDFLTWYELWLDESIKEVK